MIKALRLNLVVLLVLFSAAWLSAQDRKIDRFKETITMSDSASAEVTWEIEAKGLADSIIILPMPYKKVSALRGSLKASLWKADGIGWMTIVLPPKPDQVKFTLDFTVKEFYNLDSQEVKDFGNYAYAYKFVNNSRYRLGFFSSDIYLPAGFVVTSVDESIPKINQNSPDLPYEIVFKDGRHGIEIRGREMKMGDRVSINIRLKKESKPVLFLLAMAAFGLFYMVFFRDLLKKKEDTVDANNINSKG